ncbi:MAG TPA: flagellin [Hyphomonadaceae bacterium]|nr:flagellin [Hyphomonadaceae bacterium]
MLSVNTNYSAMVALQNLNSTNSDLEAVQNRINTGYKVSSAKDNGAVFAIAEQQRARVTSLAAVTDGINRASSAVDVALSAGDSIGKILKEMKTRAVAAQAEDLTSDQRAAIQADYDELRNNINQIANAAQFNGINLVAAGGLDLNVLMSDLSNGTSGTQIDADGVTGVVPGLQSVLADTFGFSGSETITFNLGGTGVGTVSITSSMTVQQYMDSVAQQTGGRITASYDQATGKLSYRAHEGVLTTNDLTITSTGTAGAEDSFIGVGKTNVAATGSSVTTTITNLDFTIGGAGALSVISAAANTLGTPSSSVTVSANIDTAMETLNRQLATLGSQAKALEIQHDFLTSLSDSVEKGIGNLVDADLAKESAKLQSLQIKQQLGAQALSIANQSPQVILSLFRGG